MREIPNHIRTGLFSISNSCALVAVKCATNCSDRDVIRAFMDTDYQIGRGTFIADMLEACRNLGFAHEVIFSNGIEEAGNDGYVDSSFKTWNTLLNMKIMDGNYIAMHKRHVFYIRCENYALISTNHLSGLTKRSRITGLFRIFPAGSIYD